MVSSTLELTATPGYGYGYGYGYGDGYGDGSGYGDGDGYGYGYGYGSGYGSGDGSGVATAYAAHPLVAKAKQDGHELVIGIWRSDQYGRATNGGNNRDAPAEPGLLQEVQGPLSICNRGFHATSNPSQWGGDRWWVVGLFEPVQRQGDKIASLKRLIIEELT